MTEPVPPREFHEVGWRIVRNEACAYFRTESLTSGAALVEAICRLADAMDLYPHVDFGSDGVTVRLPSTAPDQWIWLSERYLELARQISAAANELGVAVDPAGLQIVQVMIDALVIPDVMPFWRAVLGYRDVGGIELLDRHVHGPPFSFQQMDEPRPQRNRIHVDVFVPHDQAEARVAAAIAAGGHVVNDKNAPEYWTLADVEGNEVDVAPWPDRD